ncbi:MAG: GAF domain-containing sensor histidine kinase [Acidobacteriota bacterium]
MPYDPFILAPPMPSLGTLQERPDTEVWNPAAARAESGRILAAIERVHGTARAVVNELSSPDLATSLARAFAIALNASRAVVAVTDDQALGAIGVYVVGQSVPAPPPDEPTLALLLQVARQRRGVLACAPRDEVAYRLQLGDLGWRNALAVPALDNQGRTVAVLLAVNRRGPAPFGALEYRLAETIALQAAVGFERALLIERLGDWSTGLEALLAFGAAVNAHLDSSELVRHLVEHAARFLKGVGGLAGLAELSPSGELEMVSTGYWHRAGWSEGPRRFRRGEGLAGYLLEIEFPYLANDYPHDPLADLDLARRFAVGRAVCIPIKSSDGRVLGFFELHRGVDQPPFSWQDAMFLESLANTTAVAIENTRLLSDLEGKSQEIRALSAHNVTILEDERQHIARELHDEAGQALVGVKLGLQVMARLVPVEQSALREQLDHLREQVNAATTRIKDLARRLRPPTLDQLGLEVALRQLAIEYSVRAGFEVDLDLPPIPASLASAAEIAIYRIAQEALTNVAAHADALRVRLSLVAEGGRLRLTVADDGSGFDPGTVRHGLGLLGMRERVGMFGGTLSIVTLPGEGTSVEVSVPWGGGDSV